MNRAFSDTRGGATGAADWGNGDNVPQRVVDNTFQPELH